jgi:hypothetical protein
METQVAMSLRRFSPVGARVCVLQHFAAGDSQKI